MFGASTPARYADCDMNENIWHELGVPMKGAEAINQPGVMDGIRTLCSAVDITKYTKYICIKLSLEEKYFREKNSLLHSLYC